MALSAILFDKDGTLVDFDKTWGPAALAVMRAMAGDHPTAFGDLVAHLHYVLEEERFLPTSPLVAGSSDSYGHIWAAALGRSDAGAVKREIDARFEAEGLRCLTAIGAPRATIDALLARGLRLGLATNDSERSAHGQLAALGLDDAMAFVAGYDSGYGGKPAPGMVHAFARALGVAPGAIALVGDSLHDLHAARAAGAVAVAVLTGPAPRAELEPHADYVLDDVTALPALVDALSAEA